ncbi:MAG: SAM-dependent methyltransferase [Candidatus Omnitrophica bacterium]|nr:SAM-dependent methyltransferase [Candidatus Omnitrophota bacterium]
MNELKPNENVSSSFRDPSGFLFYRDGLIYRQINISYKRNYDRLMNSGLYKALTDVELLIPHEEVNVVSSAPDKAYKIIKPEPIPFISYPYEWCFSQLKDAALATLEIQKKSLNFGMSLKDCNAYNIQFRKGKLILIDTLSFEEYCEGQPWVAYRQFCQHFLAPLALMNYRDIRLNQLLRVYIDGIPLDLTSSLLQFRTRFVFSLLTHVHFHAKAQKHFADKTVNTTRGQVTRLSFMGLVDSLESAIRKLKWKAQGTEWSDYYEDTNYSPEGLQHKRQIISDFLDKVNPKIVWDLGTNVGMFSRIAADKRMEVISFDIDPLAVEKNYLQCIEKGETRILPLLFDLTNPSPGIGWDNKERMSLFERGPADTVFALALIHHLAISNNLPFNKIVDFLNKICSSLIIEFVPKEDSQTQRLLSTRKDIFTNYTQQFFECEFKEKFIIRDSVTIKNSKRILYLMKRIQA